MKISISKIETEQKCEAEFLRESYDVAEVRKLIRRGPSRLVALLSIVFSLCVLGCVTISSVVLLNLKDVVSIVLTPGQMTWSCAIPTGVPVLVYFLLPIVFVWGIVALYSRYVDYRSHVGDLIGNQILREKDLRHELDIEQIKIISNVLCDRSNVKKNENKTDYLITIKKEVPVGGKE